MRVQIAATAKRLRPAREDSAQLIIRRRAPLGSLPELRHDLLQLVRTVLRHFRGAEGFAFLGVF